MTKHDILTFLQEQKKYLEVNFGVLKIGLFGSYARDEARIDSDIDLVIEAKFKSHRNRFLLKEYLKTKLDKEIDLGYIDSLRGFVKNDISKDIIYV